MKIKLTPEQVEYVWQHINEGQAQWLEKQPFFRQCLIVNTLFARWYRTAKLRAGNDPDFVLPEIFGHMEHEKDREDV